MSLQGALAEHVREGKEILVGEIALDGSNPTPVSTSFANIDDVQVSIKGTSAPTTTIVTWDVSGSTVNLYGWKVTGTADTTLIASDGTETVGYTIIGRRRT